MATRKTEKEARRQQRLAQEQESDKRAKRRVYGGLGVALVAIAAVTIVIVTSNSASSPRLAPVAATPQTSAEPPTAAGPASRPAAVLVANTRQADQVLDTTIQAKLAQLPGVPVVINQWASWCPNCRAEFPF